MKFLTAATLLLLCLIAARQVFATGLVTGDASTNLFAEELPSELTMPEFPDDLTPSALSEELGKQPESLQDTNATPFIEGTQVDTSRGLKQNRGAFSPLVFINDTYAYLVINRLEYRKNLMMNYCSNGKMTHTLAAYMKTGSTTGKLFLRRKNSSCDANGKAVTCHNPEVFTAEGIECAPKDPMTSGEMRVAFWDYKTLQ